MPRTLRLSLGSLLFCALGVLARAAHGVFTHPHPRIGLTLVASALLVVGAVAGLRGRVWGVLLASLTAVSFGGVVAFGVAPLWFVGVAALGVVPLALVASPLYARDRGAFLVWAALALVAGVAASILGGPGVPWLRSLVGA
ncbi:MAG: hypothetical protein AB8I08_17660 [Sandaracinaceae bacterium]